MCLHRPATLEFARQSAAVRLVCWLQVSTGQHSAWLARAGAPLQALPAAVPGTGGLLAGAPGLPGTVPAGSVPQGTSCTGLQAGGSTGQAA